MREELGKERAEGGKGSSTFFAKGKGPEEQCRRKCRQHKVLRNLKKNSARNNLPFKEEGKRHETYPISDRVARDADQPVRWNDVAGTLFDFRLFHQYSAIRAGSFPMCRKR